MDIISKMISVEDLPLKDAKVFNLNRYADNRGWFTETFRQSWVDDHLNWQDFIFEYWSFSEKAGTIRGLHAQTAEQPQAKLVSVMNGSILDVLIDAREDSLTYGQYCTVTLSKDNPKMVFIPRGFYHGFITLEPNTYVGYKLDNYHNAAAEVGITYNDPTLNINWPNVGDITISERDKKHPKWDGAYKFKGLL